MRAAGLWLGVAAVGMAFGLACSSSDDRSMTPTKIVLITPSPSSGTGGTAGSEPNDGHAGAVASSGGSAGSAGTDELAGAGGGHACEGEYMCPDVLYLSHGIIKVDLPIPVADAAEAVFTACRNDECYSDKGGAEVDPSGSSFLEPEVEQHGWLYTKQFEVVSLTFDESEATPFAVLHWRFVLDAAPIASDHYSLTVQAVGASTPTTLFDGKLDYMTVAADPSLVNEGFCSHCSEVSFGTVDARSSP